MPSLRSLTSKKPLEIHGYPGIQRGNIIKDQTNVGFDMSYVCVYMYIYIHIYIYIYIYIYNYIYWLVVSTPQKIWVSWDYYSEYMEE